MALDEQLPQAFERLAGRLCDELTRELRNAATEAMAAARAEREAAVEEGSSRARAEAEQRTQAQLLAAVSDVEARARATDLVAAARLIESIRAIDRARSLSEILDTLVSCAGHEVERAGVLVVRDRELRGWRFIGFNPGGAAASSIVISFDDSGILGEAIRTGTAVSADTAGDLGAPGFAQAPSGREPLAVPIAVGGDVVAVLYADRGESDAADTRRVAATWSGTLELFARHAAKCLEAATAVKAVRVLSTSPPIGVGGAPADPDAGRQDASRDRNESAGRYARLLVSEIKL